MDSVLLSKFPANRKESHGFHLVSSIFLCLNLSAYLVVLWPCIRISRISRISSDYEKSFIGSHMEKVDNLIFAILSISLRVIY